MLSVLFLPADHLQVDKKLLNTVKESIRQGFSWATREGPLCEERKCITLRKLSIPFKFPRRSRPSVALLLLCRCISSSRAVWPRCDLSAAQKQAALAAGVQLTCLKQQEDNKREAEPGAFLYLWSCVVPLHRDHCMQPSRFWSLSMEVPYP